VVKKFRDLSFSIILIFLIAVGMYWIMEQLQKDYLPQYISKLGEKLISMVPESSDKYALNKEIEELKTRVEKNEVSPEQIEKMAADIFNINYFSDSLTLAEASELIVTREPQSIEIREPNDKKWRELEHKLENLYRFEQKKFTLGEDLKFQVDRDLKILIDDTVRQHIIATENKYLVKEIENLRKNDALIFVETLDSSMVPMNKRILQIRADKKLPDPEKVREIRNVLVLKVDSIQTAISIRMDSVKLNYQYHYQKEKERKERLKDRQN
jgi:hypothetical protein